jgi:hypothetical protein
MHQQSKLALLTEVRQDIPAMESELAELRRVESYLSKSPPPETEPTEKSVPIPAADDAPAIAPSGRFKSVTSLAAAAAEIIRENGRTMRSSEIAAILVQGGYPASGSDARAFPNTVFSAMSRRTDLFRKVSRGLWNVTKPATEANGVGH